MRAVIVFAIFFWCVPLFGGDAGFTGLRVGFEGTSSGRLIDNAVIEGTQQMPLIVRGNDASIIRGIVGQGVRLNGNTYLEAESAGCVTPGKDDYTVTAWVRLAANDNGGMLLSKRSSGNWYSLSVTRKEIRYEMGKSPSSYVALLGHIDSGESWHHIVITNDRQGNAVLYVDGVEVVRKDVNSQKYIDIGAGAPLKIGASYKNQDIFCGEFDEVEVIPGVLTAEEVAHQYKDKSASAYTEPSRALGKAQVTKVFRFDSAEFPSVTSYNLTNVKCITKNNQPFGALFDGKTSEIKLPAELIEPKAFTINFWVYFPEIAEGVYFDAPGMLKMMSWSSNKFWALVPEGMAPPFYQQPWIYGPYLNTHKWTMLSLSYGNEECRIYIDGLGFSGRTVKLSRQTGALVWGRKFKGILGAISVYNGVLSESEMRAIYTKEKQTFCDSLLDLDIIALRSDFLEHTPIRIPVEIRNKKAEDFSNKFRYIVSSNGKTVLSGESLNFVVNKGGKASINLELPELDAGTYDLSLFADGDRDYSRCSKLTILSQIKQNSVKNDSSIKKEEKVIVEFDPAKTYSKEAYYQVGDVRTVNSAIGAYREGLQGGRFGYRFAVTPGKPYRIEFEYPDDKERTILITDGQSYNSNIGYTTGELETPCSGKMVTKSFVIYPNQADTAFIVYSRGDDCPAAMGKVKVYEMDAELPAMNVVCPSDGGRTIGHYWEDNLIGVSYGLLSTSQEERAAGELGARIGRLMQYYGWNSLRWVKWWYGGALYKSTHGELDAHCATDASKVMIPLKQFGVIAQPNFNMLTWPELLEKANYNIADIENGTETINQVLCDGRVQSNTGEWNAAKAVTEFNKPGPVFNPLDPYVRKSVIDVFREATTEWSENSNYRGPSIEWNASTTLWFGNLERGYNDGIIKGFEKECGITIPVEGSDKKRFSKRYSYIIANKDIRDKWINYRCSQIVGLFKDIVREIKKGNSSGTLTLSFDLSMDLGVNENFIAKRSDDIRYGKYSCLDAFKEGGLDFEQLSKIDGLIIEIKFGFDSEYRHWRENSGYRPRPNLFNTLWTYDTNLRQFMANNPRPAIWCFTHYFENFDTGAPKNFWWGSEYKNHGGAMRGGVHTTQHLVRALSDCDALSIGIGGIINPTAFDEERMKKFARSFRALPNQRLHDVAGQYDPVVIRSGETDGHGVFYIINKEFFPVDVHIVFAESPGDITDVTENSTTFVGGSELDLHVLPYGFTTYYLPKMVSIKHGSVRISNDGKQWIESAIDSLKTDKTTLLGIDCKQKIKDDFSYALDRIVEAYSNNKYSLVRDYMATDDIVNGRNEIALIKQNAKYSTQRKKLREPSVHGDAIKVDGDLSEWGTLPNKISGDSPQSEIGWDIRKGDHGYFIAANVPDEVHFQNSDGYKTYFGDSVQLAFDTANDKMGKYINGKTISFQIALAHGKVVFFREDPKSQQCLNVKDGMCSIVRDESKKITVYEVYVPFSEFTDYKNFSRMSFSILINDNNGFGRNECREFTGGIGKKKDTRLFVDCQFDE